MPDQLYWKLAHQVRSGLGRVGWAGTVQGEQRLQVLHVGARESDGARLLEVMERPDDAGHAAVERVTGGRAPLVVLRVSRPVRARAEGPLGIARDPFDRTSRPRFVPRGAGKRLVPRGVVKHARDSRPHGM